MNLEQVQFCDGAWSHSPTVGWDYLGSGGCWWHLGWLWPFSAAELRTILCGVVTIS